MFEIVVDYGEVEAALRAIHGVARGLASDATANNARAAFQRASVDKFSKSLDLAAVGNPALLGHVYEYNPAGRDENEVNTTEAGRLWRIQQKGSGGRFTGRVFFMPSTEYKPIPDAIAKDADAAGVTLARHIFSNKARVLENVQAFQSQVGVQKYSKRVGGTKNPRSLVYQNPMGDIEFRFARTVSNPYFGQFRAYWEMFWNSTAQRKIIAPMSNDWTRTANSEGKRLIQSEVRAASSTPIPRNIPGFHQTVNGKPFGGMFNTAPKGRVAKAIERVLRDRWSRI